ncbi:Uncharacterized protein TCM_036941 [Theobroma cacao]|uniref:Uncharacterized protein n=1 Tax=Theobroma cacao TaxID=3641 RepID=A0A061GIZ1_THECC|nr:Uncharacterized protein TCM_036941 [Theobroma cacao]
MLYIKPNMLSRKWRWLVSCNLILKPECHTDQAASGGSLSCSFNMLSCPASSNRATSSVPNIQLYIKNSVEICSIFLQVLFTRHKGEGLAKLPVQPLLHFFLDCKLLNDCSGVCIYY